MEFCNVSNRELARRTGLSYRTVKELKNGERNGTLYTWVTIAQSLGMTVDQILEGEFDEE